MTKWVEKKNSVICGRSAELFSNFLENWKQPIRFQQPHPTRKCAPTAQIGRRDGPICHSRDLIIDLISKLIFNFVKKEAPPTRVKQGASHGPASWPFRPFELELRNETLTIAFSAFDSTWRPNFINFVLSADFLSNFSFISSIKSLGSELNQMKFLKWYSDR